MGAHGVWHIGAGSVWSSSLLRLGLHLPLVPGMQSRTGVRVRGCGESVFSGSSSVKCSDDRQKKNYPADWPSLWFFFGSIFSGMALHIFSNAHPVVKCLIIGVFI